MSYVKTNAVEDIVAMALDAANAPLTGLTNIKARIWRVSDGQALDWADMTFKAFASVGTMLSALSEVSATYFPGLYKKTLNTSSITNPTVNDIYQVEVIQDAVTLTAANTPQIGEIRVGQAGYTVFQSFSYNPTTNAVAGIVWAEHDDQVVAAPTSVSVKLYSAAGSLLLTMTDAAPDAQGIFSVSGTYAFATNTSYYTISSVTLPTVGVITSGKGIFTAG